MKQVGIGYLKSQVGEPSTEYVQEVLNMLGQEHARALYMPEDVSRFDIGQANEAFWHTFKGMMVLGAVGAGGSYMADVRRAANSDHQQRVMQQIVEREEASNLAEVSPDERADLTNEFAQQSGAEYVYVEGAKLMETLAELEAREAKATGRLTASESLEEVMPGLLAEARQAAETGGDVKIPTGDFVSKLGKTDLGRELWDNHATFDPDEAMTGAERRGFDRSKALQEYEAAAKEAMEADEAVADSARDVQNVIVTMLRNAYGGERWTDEKGNRVDATSQAAFLRDFIVVQAMDLGISPSEFYNRYPLVVGTGAAQTKIGGAITPAWAKGLPELQRLQARETTPQQFVNAVQQRLDAEGDQAWQKLGKQNPELRGKRKKPSKKTIVRNMLREAKAYAEKAEVWERPEPTDAQREALERARKQRGGPDILSFIRQAGGLTREQWEAAGVDLESRESLLKRRGLLRTDAEGTFGNMAEALSGEGYLRSFQDQGDANTGSGDFETAFLDAVNAALDGQLVVSEVDGFTDEMMEAMAEDFAESQAQDASADEATFGDDDVLFQTEDADPLVDAAEPRAQQILREVRQRNARQKLEAAELAAPGRAVPMVGPDGRAALAGPDVREPGGFRLTFFRDKEPTGHQEYPTLEAAILDGLREGFRVAESDELFQTRTDTDAFREWFGDSKVVDENGEPLVVYHGTGSHFDEATQMVWGSVSPELANDYAGMREARGQGEARLMPLHMSIARPFDADALPSTVTVGSFWNEALAQAQAAGRDVDMETARALLRRIRESAVVEESGPHYSRQDFWFQPTDQFGQQGAQAIREMFDLLGFDGVSMKEDGQQTYGAFRPEQVKSVNNRGTFDGNDPRILFDTDQEGDRRGGFRANDPDVGNRPSINLYEAADASTFLHESAHFFLHVYGDLAARGEATPRMQRDLQTLLDWFGVKDAETWGAMTLDEQRKHHEAFAASYELYLSEGKSPSSAMGRVFQKFGRWLRTIYRTIRDDLNGIHRREFGEDLPVLTDDVRRVMDRMVASEDQVTQAEAVRNMVRVWKDQEQSGMTDAEWQQYLEDNRLAHDKAVDDLARKAMASMGWLRRSKDRARKAVTKEARQARANIKSEVEREVDALPVTRARRFLRTGEIRDENGNTVDQAREAGWQTESATPKLNREQARALLPEGMDLNALRGLTADKGGLSPDSVARLFGYPSGQAMVQEMATEPSRAATIDAEVDARMLEQHSELATAEAVEDAVEIALHNEIRGRLLADEFREATKAAAPTRAQTKAARESAREMLRSKSVGDVSPRDFSVAETRARRRAAEALEADDMVAFAQEKRRELLLHHMVLEAAKAREEIASIRKGMARVFGNDAQMAKTREVSILRAARAVLSVFGLDNGQTARSPMEHLAPVKDYDPVTYAELEPEVQRLASIAQGIDGEAEGKWQKMTLDQFRELGEAIEAMWNKSRRARQILLDGKRRDRNDVAQEMARTLEENGAKVPEVDKPKTWLDRRKDWLRGYFANATRVEQLMRNLDGGKPGIFTSLYRRIKDAGNNYRTELRERVERYESLLRKHDWGPRVQIDAEKELGIIFRDKAHLLGLLRHLGNNSNKKKALVSQGWATIRDDGSLDTSVWDKWFNEQIRKGLVTKADFDLLQAMWDMNEELKPALQKAHYRNYGYYFREVDAQSFDVVIDGQVHTYRGGYVPARPRKEGNVAATAHEIDTVQKFNDSFASVPRGMTKERNEHYTRPLSFELEDGAEHIGQVLRFVHMQEAVNDVQRVLLHPEVEKRLTAKNQALYDEALLPWLHRSAQQQTSDVVTNPALKLVGRIASNVNMSIMFANVSNALQNYTGLVEALTRVQGKHVLAAIGAYIKNPAGATRDAVALSQELANRQGRQQIEIRQKLKKTVIKPNLVTSARQWFSEHGYFIQTFTQNHVDTIVWTAAYNQALTNGATEADAVQQGDAAIRQTQMATDPEDVSKWEASSAFTRALFPFQSWFIRWANNQVGSWSSAGTAGARASVALFGYMLPLVLAQLISDVLRGRLEDEEDDGYGDDILSMAVRSMTSGTLAAVPVFGRPAEAIINTFVDDDIWNDRMPAVPIVSTFERARRAIKDAVGDEADVRDVQDIVGFFSNLAGVPLGSILSRPVYGYQALTDTLRDDPQDSLMAETFGTPAEYARGVLTGR